LIAVSFSITSAAQYIIPGFPVLGQRKDTRILDVDYPYVPLGNYADHPWDGSHANADFPCSAAQNRCWAAAIIMMNNFYGGTLTQDELVYELKGGGAPEGDTPHWMGHWADPPEHRPLHAWALGISEAQLNESSSYTESQLKSWLQANRPIFWSNGNHAMVVYGYRDQDSQLELLVANRSGYGNSTWATPASLGYVYHRCPSTSVSPLYSDYRINMDSDNDGVCDFDELLRFHTDPYNPDSDGDGLNDKDEIRAYSLNHPYGQAGGRSCTPPYGTNPECRAPFDADNDGIRAELDYDSDNGGAWDGEEDFNLNGILDAGETGLFVSSDDPGLQSYLYLSNIQIDNRYYWAREIETGPNVTIQGPSKTGLIARDGITIGPGLTVNGNPNLKIQVKPEL